MNQLLEYLKEIETELEVYSERIQDLASDLREKRKFFQGFGYKEDKKNRIFTTDMTDDEFEEFKKWNKIILSGKTFIFKNHQIENIKD